ncbi:MAG: ABC transporter ATP-binding protein, partial [Halobacteriovoraceae bacterium]|nr:ABC transporter ATP-binding protein [Halobacteriovoraceae bacterium]
MIIWSVTKKLIPYIKEHSGKIIISILLSFVLAALQAAQVKLIKPLFDQGLNPEGTFEETMAIAATLLGIGLLQFPTRFFHFYFIRYSIEKTTCSIRDNIFKKIQKLPTSFYTKSRQGGLISHFLSDAHLYAQGIRGAIDLIREPLKALAMLTMAIMADWQLTLIILLMTPLFVLIFEKTGKKLRINQAHVQEKTAHLSHHIAEGIGGHKITKAFNLQNYIWKRFCNAQQKLFSMSMKNIFVEEIAHPLVELIVIISLTGVIVFAHYRISSQVISTGDFVSFMAALILLMDPIRKFSQANVRLNQAQAAAERVSHLLSLSEEQDSGIKKITSFKNSIKLHNLSFDYGRETVLHDLSMEIKKGQKVAFVGLSGSGKSTLINLLLGLYPVNKGMISIDGISIDQFKLEHLRNLFGLVSQDLFLFNDTIRENLTLGGKFTEEKIYQSLEISYATDFVLKLPKGIDTIIGDRGAELSGGQQQRITIARAWLQNPEILLFDEATSSLDNESELVVQKAL